MADIFLGLLGAVAGTISKRLVSSAAMALVGKGYEAKLAAWRRTTLSHVTERLRRAEPPSPATHHDLRRALCLAHVSAARRWLFDLSCLPEHDFTGDQYRELTGFIERVHGYLGRVERAAYERTTDFAGWTGDDLMTRLLEGLPEIGPAPEDLGAVTRALAESFEAWLQGKEGQGLPEAARHRLLKRSEDGGITLFGQAVLDAFIEVLKSGDYPQATRAFDHHLSGELRKGLRTLEGQVGELAALKPVIERVESHLDQARLTLAKVDDRVEEIKTLTERIEARLAVKGQLALSRKPVGEGRYTPFVEMTFTQRRTTFVGREGELSQLTDFLEDPTLFSWWQIAGAGGQGKSRLALHLLDTLGPGWDAGFLASEDLDRFDWRRESFARPTLCIIDYAAAPQKAKRVVAALEALAERSKPGATVLLNQRVRVLILERAGYDFDASTTEMNWLRTALDKPGTHVLLKDRAFADHPLDLGLLPPHAMVSIGQSWRYFREKAPLPEDKVRNLLIALLGSSGTSAKAWRPLFAMMYAEVLDTVRADKAGASQVESILAETLKEERTTLWRDPNGAPITPSVQAQNMACLATMIGSLTEKQLFQELRTLAEPIEDLKTFHGDPRGPNGDQACLVLGYPPEARDRDHPTFQARQPDLLGEYMVLWSLEDILSPFGQDEAEERARTLVRQAALLDRDALLGFLIRLEQDFPGHPVTKALAAVPWPSGDYRDADTNPPAFFGWTGLLSIMLEGGASPTKAMGNGGFPLLVAAQNGHADCVAALLDNGADPNAVDPQDGTFPLLVAAQNGHADCLAALLDNGAAPNAVNQNNGAFPLLMAAQNGHADCLAALLDNGADPNAIHQESGTVPLLMAAQEGHADCVAALLDNGADPSAVEPQDGTFPLLMAAHNGHADCLAALLDKSADPNAINPQTGIFPLLMAAHNGHADCVAALLGNGAAPNTIHEPSGCKPLLQAVFEGHDDCASLLLAQGATPLTEEEEELIRLAQASQDPT